MKVILRDDVPKVGGRFEVVDVSDGYARNYLLPRGLAVPATKGALKEIESQRKLAERKEVKAKEEVEGLVRRLAEAVVEVPVQVGEGGRMFHHVRADEVARHIQEQLGVEMHRRDVDLEEPIKTLGIHTIRVRVRRERKVDVRINVVAK